MSTMTMTTTRTPSRGASPTTDRFARSIAASKRVRWDIDADVIRGRRFDMSQKFLPDGLSLVNGLDFLSPNERTYLSQIQGRTYANVFGLVERFINAKVLEIARDYVLTDQIALEGLIRFSDEELKHQELFRRVEAMAGDAMPEGYRFTAEPNAVARAVLGASTWAVLALTLDIELFTQLHYLESIAPDPQLSPLYRDIFLYHWKEESQHAIMDEIELVRVDRALTAEARERAVDEFIGLVGAVDGILHAQAEADAEYFVRTCGRSLTAAEARMVEFGVMKAYHWQYIISGAQHPRFVAVLADLVTEAQARRIQDAVGELR